MVKVYINGTQFTVTSGKKNVTYPVGAGAVSLCSGWDFENPYAFFEDFDKVSLKTFAKAELAKLASFDEFDTDALVAFDKKRKTKLYADKSFNIIIVAGEKGLPCFLLDSAKDLFSLEILTAAHFKKPVKICENCGEYFIPSGRSDSVYCDKITKSGYSCKKIGAHRQYRINSSLNEIKKLYDKVTKHNRYLKSKGALSAYEYNSWMSEASLKYAAFKSGDIEKDEFEAWLSGKEYNPTPRARGRNTMQDYLL